MVMIIMTVVRSHPAWVCGLKLELQKIVPNFHVTPRVGVRIETLLSSKCTWIGGVTPRVGVRIETANIKKTFGEIGVTPRVGVRIETQRTIDMLQSQLGHTPRGCAD